MINFFFFNLKAIEIFKESLNIKTVTSKLVKHAVRVTQSKTLFLGLIFPVQVSLDNAKSFSQKSRLWSIYKYVPSSSMIPALEK